MYSQKEISINNVIIIIHTSMIADIQLEQCV